VKRYWTDEEIDILRDRDLTHKQLMELLPHRSWNSIRKKSYEYGLQRTMRSSGHITQEEADKIWDNGEFRQVIEGHLLGDACIDKKGHAFRISTIRKSYAYWLQKFLNATTNKTNSIISYPSVIRHWKTGDCLSRPYWMTVCCCKGIFGEQRERWYPIGIKIVPKDLVLTSVVCNRWYIDDGWLSKKENVIELCTDSFTEEDREFLASQIDKNVGIKTSVSNHRRKYFRICIYKKEQIRKFLEYIGQSPTKDYAYKWGKRAYAA